MRGWLGLTVLGLSHARPLMSPNFVVVLPLGGAIVEQTGEVTKEYLVWV